MHTKEQVQEINDNWHKYNTKGDYLVKTKLRELSTKDLEYVATFEREQLSNLKSNPFEIATISNAIQRKLKYIDFLIKKRESK